MRRPDRRPGLAAPPTAGGPSPCCSPWSAPRPSAPPATRWCPASPPSCCSPAPSPPPTAAPRPSATPSTPRCCRPTGGSPSRAYLRVVTNVGIGVGTGIAALVLVADTRGAYTAAILADVATFVAVFAMYALLPTPQAGPRGTADESAPRTGSALRNLPYLVVAGLAGVLGLQFAMIEVGVPLWIVDHTEAPRVLVACTLVVNTILVVALQVRATRGTEEPTAAARIFRRGGLLVALSCAAFALAGGLPAWAAVLVLLAGASLQALGEVLGQAAAGPSATTSRRRARTASTRASSTPDSPRR
ncbi:hypothetical protein ACFQ1I_11020 [Kitasatospora arboriphila]